MKQLIIGLVALAVGIGAGAYAVAHLQTVPVPAPTPQEGALSGPDVYFPTAFRQTVTIGGNVLATSSQGAATYTAAQLINTTLIQQTAPGALTVTLPASSTLGGNFIPRPGDIRTIFLAALTSNVTVAGGTGTTLLTASSTKVVNATGIGRLTFVRKVNSDILVEFSTAI